MVLGHRQFLELPNPSVSQQTLIQSVGNDSSDLDEISDRPEGPTTGTSV